MKEKVLSSLKFDSTRILAIVYTVMVGPLLFYSFKFIPLMNRKIGLTVALFMVQTTINTGIFTVIQRNASRKMRQFLQHGGDRENLDSSVRGEAYRYPIPMTLFMMVSWMVLSNILLFLPLYFLTSGTMTDMLIINLLCLAAAISTLPLAYFIAESTAVGFLDLDESRNLPEPSGTWKLTIGSRIVIVSFTIILSIFINFLTATMIGNAYQLSYRQNIFNMFIVGMESFLSTAILSWYFARSVARPLGSAVAALRDVASGDGDLTKRLGANTPDEVGDIARHFNSFASNLQDLIRTIGQGASTVAASSTELSTTSTEIASNTEEVSTTTHAVAASTEQATTNISAISTAAQKMSGAANTVASAIEEMSASLNEVSRNCVKEAEVAKDANNHAKGSKEIMNRLESSARSIGTIIDVINDIADQTNLLALNATIEAASAGDAGRGFAVVASEVKELARQSAKATQDIGAEIGTMQSNAQSAVDSLDAIIRIIEEVDSISQNIVSAVEEQSVTVNEISRNITDVSASAGEVARNVAESATGLNEVSSHITGVNSAVTETSRNVSHITASAGELAKLSENLRALVGQFRI